MQRIETIDALNAARKTWQKMGARVALVPTMGALHAGHIALVEAARKVADIVVVSIYVNPTQFGVNEDFAKYPRTLDADKTLLAVHKVDALWLPDNAIMYPHGFNTTIHVAGVSEGLCGAIRAGHFDGVALVVHKLLNQVMPDVALFGEKDYQQCCVIKQMVRDLNLRTQVQSVPTLREADGLAMSSRNRYLSEAERTIAPLLYKQLQDIRAELMRGSCGDADIERSKHMLSEAGFAEVQYLELRVADTLLPIAIAEYEGQPARLLVAAKLGTTRLIDNIAVGDGYELHGNYCGV